MEISVDEKVDENTYVIKIGKKFMVSTICNPSEQEAKEWVRGVQKLYGKNGRKLVVGVAAEHSFNYAGNAMAWRRGPQKDRPYELLQLCIGTNCLLLEISNYCPIPKVLKYFLSDNRTTVVGVGIEKMAVKLEEDYGLMMPRRKEIRELAEKVSEKEDLSSRRLPDLAKIVLGEDVDFVKPKRISWRNANSTRCCPYSLADDMVKYASAEVFLACEMGSKLPRD